MGLGRSRRWAKYPSTYFSSDLLPVYNGTRLPPILPTSSSTFSSERHLLWERILYNTRMQGSVSRDIRKVHQHNSPPPLPIAPPPPLPPLPPPTPAAGFGVDDARAGAHQPGTSRDGESDMEMSDSDS
jgi:zinc finger CCHC domain-containing protein 8